MRTFSAKPTDIEKKWYIVDASEMILGRLSTVVATILQGKNKSKYTPHIDTGDYVIVVNAQKINVTGKKESQKIYRHHSGYIGGLKEITLERLREKHPERIIEKAVWGMMPKGRLGRAMIKKLKVYAGEKHPHEAQKPEVLELKTKG